MSKVDEAMRLVDKIRRNYPSWPSTFSVCHKCKKNSGRGGGLCAHCATTELAELIGHDLAHEFWTAVVSQHKLVMEIKDKCKTIPLGPTAK